MSDDIKQRWADSATNVSNTFRKIDLSDGSPALAGDVIVAGISVDSAGVAIPFATTTLQTAGNAILTTIDADTGAIATSAASIDGKTPVLGQALAAASVPVVLTAAQLSTLTPPAAITGFSTAANQSTLIGHVDGIETLLTSIAAAQLPDSHNVTVDNPSIAVTGTFWQATQPVSNAGTFAVQAAQSGDWAITAKSMDPTDASIYQNGATPYTGGSFTVMIPWANLRDSSGNEIATATTTPGGSDRGIVVRTAGTVSAAQSGTWNITNVSGTISLPTGAATAAKQPALGTAGTASADVITVQGITGMMALKVDGSAVTQPVSGTFWQATQPVSLASVPSHAVTNAGTFAVQVDGAALTKLTDIETNTDSGAVVGNGAASTAQRVTLANDSTGQVVLAAGSATVGKLAANSGVDIGDVDVTSLPALAAGTNLIGRVSSSDETSTVYNGTTALTPKYAAIAASSSGNNTLVAAVTSKKIRVLAYNLMGNGAVNAKFQSGAGGTDLTGLKYIAAAGGGICAPYNPVGWFETASNTLLNLNLSGAVAVGGELIYVEV